MRLYRVASATGIDGLRQDTASSPTPARGQVVVRVRAASLNFRDLSIVHGRNPTRPGLVPLSDGAGEVLAVGPDVTRVAVGDRIAGIFMQTWLAGPMRAEYAPSALGGAIDGVLAEEVLFEQSGLVKLPDHLSFEEGAALPCAAVTAWNALHGGQYPVQPGHTVLVLGTGGVSIFALQFARMAGCRVIATSSSDEKLARVRELGADTAVNYRAEPEWQEAVLRATDGRGVDHVVEVGGAGTLPRSIAACALGGQIALIGVLTGGQVDPATIMRRSITLRGIYVGSRAMFEAMNRAILHAALRPVIDRVFDFDDAQNAYRHLEAAGHLGKVVIRV